jgi:glucan phosphoethanolaminetransferase (alkaline phosphatase superfamily)
MNFERFRPILYTLKVLFEWLLTAYAFYLLFLFFWSTFARIFSLTTGFVLALLLTVPLVGFYGWSQYLKLKPPSDGDNS